MPNPKYDLPLLPRRREPPAQHKTPESATEYDLARAVRAARKEGWPPEGDVIQLGTKRSPRFLQGMVKPL